MRTLIVEDEPLARRELRGLLADFPWIEICGEAANAREALALVARWRPELLLLDIEMPGRNGFEFLDALPPPHPHVIFTTAYDQFAVHAFDANALDYLLKPIEPVRLAAALDKIRQRYPTNAMPPLPVVSPIDPLREKDRVFVRDGDRCWFVQVGSIRLLAAEDNYTRVYFDDQSPLLHRTLTAMEQRLPPRLFLRANRSELVNLQYVESIDPWFSSSFKVRLRGGREVEFSRRQAQILRDRLSL